MTDTWTPARIRQLTELVSDGVSYKEIAARMGITKSTAIGKAHRLNLDHPNSPLAKPAAEAPQAESAIVFPPSGHCLWSFGHVDEKRFRFCGEPATAPGGPWCAEHRQRVYVRVPK